MRGNALRVRFDARGLLAYQLRAHGDALLFIEQRRAHLLRALVLARARDLAALATRLDAAAQRDEHER